MPYFRKKPVVIEAEQWFPGKDVPGVQHSLVGETWEAHWRFGVPVGTPYYFVVTPEGKMAVKEGDWIIKVANDEFHLCAPDIFAKMYEPVPAPLSEQDPVAAFNAEIKRKGL